jgi:hypothetical protein
MGMGLGAFKKGLEGKGLDDDNEPKDPKKLT